MGWLDRALGGGPAAFSLTRPPWDGIILARGYPVSRWEVSLYIDDAFQGALDGAKLEEVAVRALEAHGLAGPARISLALVGDEAVRQLNRIYRGQDQVTDVLSFSLAGGGFPPPPDGIPYLGEVVVAYPQAERQARELGHPVETEAAWLVAHGVLHLLGYDHETEEDEARMREMEARALAWEAPAR